MSFCKKSERSNLAVRSSAEVLGVKAPYTHQSLSAAYAKRKAELSSAPGAKLSELDDAFRNCYAAFLLGREAPAGVCQRAHNNPLAVSKGIESLTGSSRSSRRLEKLVVFSCVLFLMLSLGSPIISLDSQALARQAQKSLGTVETSLVLLATKARTELGKSSIPGRLSAEAFRARKLRDGKLSSGERLALTVDDNPSLAIRNSLGHGGASAISLPLRATRSRELESYRSAGYAAY